VSEWLGVPFETIRFVQGAYRAPLMSREEAERKSAYLGAGALVAAATSCALIPVLGIAGAAIANLLTEATLLVLHVVGTARYIDGISVTATTSVATLGHAFAHTLSEARDASA
jgi:O-antigen/teichoic acid export membrane protein